jgi:PAS domain S-box-containing protein
LTEEGDAKILVVDDEKHFVEAHARMLRDNYAVETAENGEKALDLIDNTVDVVVLDRQMPGMDGDEVASRIRDEGFDCRVVLLTAVEPDFDIIELGIDDYLTKPASERDLIDCIEEVLEWTDYDDSMQDFFALSNKRDVLVEEKPGQVKSDRLTDIERRIEQKAQEGLEKNKEVLETLVQSSPAAIVTLDTDGRVDIWNPSAEEIFGWSSEEVVGERPPVFTDETHDQLTEVREQLFTDSIVTNLDVECVTKTGAPIDVSLSAAPLYDSDGSMYGTMFVMMDITERKQREQRLSVLDRILRHNIRNDLTVIIGRAKTLQEKVSGETTKHMEMVAETGEQLLEMSEKARDVQELLDTEANDITERNLEDIIERTVTRACNEFPTAEVTVSVETDKTTAVIASEGLDVALWNLVENAIEHNDTDQPTVSITVTSESDKNQQTTTVAIADDGPGIPSDETAVLDQGIEDRLTHGSSLGLWLIKWIIDQSGGELSFEINQYGGTTATVTLRRQC